MDTWILANPHAGSAEEGRNACVRAEALGLRWFWCDGEDEASRLARDAATQGVERVVAAGGDGSVHLVVQALMDFDARPELGVLPLGTGNDLARSLGMPLDPLESLELLAVAGRVRSVDVGRVRLDGPGGIVQRWMINASSAGFAGEVDQVLDEASKKRWGPLAYIGAAVEVLADLPVHAVRIEIDGSLVDHVESVGVMVANARTVGGGVQIAPTADLEDGLLDVTAIESGSRLELAPVGEALRNGSILSQRKVRHHMGRAITLIFEPAIAINVDGELIGRVTRADYEAVPSALSVVVGPGYRRETVADFAGWTSSPG